VYIAAVLLQFPALVFQTTLFIYLLRIFEGYVGWKQLAYRKAATTVL
jgi:hypothetical protein